MEPPILKPLDPPPPPTGPPVIPPQVVPVMGALAGIATAVASFVPVHTVGFKVSAFIIGICSIFGIVSPGWRRKP